MLFVVADIFGYTDFLTTLAILPASHGPGLYSDRAEWRISTALGDQVLTSCNHSLGHFVHRNGMESFIGSAARMLQPIWARQSALKESGLLLGVLNLALAVICTITFFGVLALTFILSAWLQSFTGNPRALAPFPVPVLLVLYAVAFVVMWVRFAKGLQPRSTSRAVRTGLVGAIPLLGLALLGYMGVVWILLTGDFGPDSMLEATVVVYGVLSTLILFAGVACMVTTALLTPRPHS